MSRKWLSLQAAVFLKFKRPTHNKQTSSHTAVFSSTVRLLLCLPADVIAKTTDFSCCTASSVACSAVFSATPSTIDLAWASNGGSALAGAIFCFVSSGGVQHLSGLLLACDAVQSCALLLCSHFKCSLTTAGHPHICTPYFPQYY